MLSTMRSTPVATGAVLYIGALVALNAAGFLVRAATATTLKVAGILGDQPFQVPGPSISNLGADGAKTAEVQMGVTALLNNYDSDPVGQDDVLNDCYMIDDETVAATSGGSTRSKAGRVIEVTDQGVWVAIGVPGVNVTGSAGTQGATGSQGPQGPQGPQGATGA